MQNIVLDVMAYVDEHVADEEERKKFKPYDAALRVIWPGLFKIDDKAALLVSIAIYLDVADRKGFTVYPRELEELRF